MNDAGKQIRLVPFDVARQERCGNRSRASLYRDIAAQRLPRLVKVGSRSFFVEEELDAALQRLVDSREAL